ncbi:cytochrome P450 CYP5313 [Phycomyces blakesleeanus]|uniref:Cytochrome P450 CYP5313 n=2 Tax=Phycomyces blakesleeanus TaxID=4837 RepID=A0A167Q391_PHYB8|nr:cytochrome P450 CYP5313 [Phycomyces blakesleeanus NRRL 1555(-)]OAD78994.1 cytochrome P450 CYP5313 [Phycomyces blakesleeanus NRRL 1555(-)]|eukprot:XP_018297034.1 cytochrome P450 CYP5313 [Phycomyces blakesleeanus NRRL 1555(-)]
MYWAFFGPLSRIPGPFAEKFISGSELFFGTKPGQRFKKVITYHQKYGHVVRIGPKAISVSDKDIIKQVLVTEDFEKGPSYTRFQNGTSASMLDTTDKIFHKQRAISPAFSIKYIKSLEPLFETVTDDFIKRINREIAANKQDTDFATVDIWWLLRCLAFDIIGETSLGGTFNMLSNNDHIMLVSVGKLLRGIDFVINHPWIAKLILLRKVKKNPDLVNFVTNLIKERVKNKQRRDDIIQILINTQQAPKEEDRLSSDDIVVETTLFLVAGAETTSNTIGFSMIELCRNKSALNRLRQEIDAIELEDGKQVFHQCQLRNLPYLNAVINETMRLNTIPSNGLERLVTRDIVIKGDIYVPSGTTVRCYTGIAQTHPDYWSDPMEFKPERWLPNADPKPDMGAYNPFSAGSRNCVGKEFAMNEMRLAISTIIKHYDIEPISEEMEVARETRYFITLTLASSSFKIRMKHRNS